MSVIHRTIMNQYNRPKLIPLEKRNKPCHTCNCNVSVKYEFKGKRFCNVCITKIKER